MPEHIISPARKHSSPRLHILNIALILCASLCLGLMSLYFAAGEYKLSLFRFYLTQPKVLILNILPYLLIFLFVYFLTGRSWIGFLVSGGLTLLYSWAQYWKLMARNDPVFAEDLTIFSEAMQMSGQYIQFTWQIIFSAVLVILGTVVFFALRKTLIPRRIRAIGTAAVIILCCWLYPNIYTSKEVYNSMMPWPAVNQWFETNKYISRGGIYPFIYSIQTALPNAPEGYDEAQTQAILAQYNNDDIPHDRQVSIITVMYEAFSDLSVYTDRITGADPYEAFHALQEESYHGNLVTNIFAGGTIDTERCVLTGFSSLTNFRRPSWSYARYFADQGYQINGAHAGYEAFYNRRNVNENLGISDYRFIENYYEALVGHSNPPSDSTLLPDIASYCKEQMKNGPVFSFNVTYQNHGPYDTETAYFDREYVPQQDLSESDYLIINNYLSGIEDTANNMLAMADSFRDCEEPVILVFFGDHKPWLGEQSVTYSALGIDIASQTDESFYNYYSTEYVIWANPAAQEALGTDFSGTGPTVSPCFLMNVLFEKCGWEGPGFLKLTNEVMSQIPIVHTTNRYQIDGIMVDSQDLSDEQTALINRMAQAQFYLAQDAGGKHPQ